GLGLMRFQCAVEELVDGREIYRERVDPAIVRRQDLMTVSIETGKSPDVVPYLFIGRMEDVGAIAVVFDAGVRVCCRIAVAADVRAFLNDQNGLVQLAGDTFRDDGAEESAAYDNIGIVSQVHGAR